MKNDFGFTIYDLRLRDFATLQLETRNTNSEPKTPYGKLIIPQPTKLLIPDS